MKLFKPGWISHNSQPIFSIDIHPDGSRFATGGQGDGGSSGKVMIWNMMPVCNRKDELNNEVPKVLCVMENHLACVNCVRWSINGRYLASGGDDRLIMIWQFAGYGATGVFGGSSNIKTSSGERWRCLHTLKGHTGDVLDLAWSPGNQWLASCSIDNTVVIWNVDKFPEITTVLKGHTSLVKGVTWDPVGSYIATQSDDKSVKIWKVLDWKLETTITKPFDELDEAATAASRFDVLKLDINKGDPRYCYSSTCTATTHVLRLSWSPDGGYLVSAHAMNNSGPTAQIIERSGWKTEMDFVGHRKAITCTRFNGCVFSKAKTLSSESKPASLPYTCCAVGSRDRSLSIWLTSLRRPLVVIHDLFESSLMDISWSFSGYFLLCCSWDGSVAYVEFTDEELGNTLSQEEKNKLHMDTYGKSSALVSQPLVIENPAMLSIQEKKKNYSATNGIEKAPKTPLVYPTKQIETRTPTGKRRIIPVFVAPQEALGGIPTPFGSSSAFGKINSALKTADKLKDDSLPKAEVSPAKSITDAEESPARADEKKSPEKNNSEKVDKVEQEKTDKALEVASKSPQKQTVDTTNLKKAVLDSRLCEPAKTTELKPTEEPRERSSEKPAAQKSVSKSFPVTSGPPLSEESGPAMSRKPGKATVSVKRKQLDTTASPAKKKHKQIRKEHSRIFPRSGTPTVPSATEKEPPAVSLQTSSRFVDASTNILPFVKPVRKLSVQSPANAEITLVSENELNSSNEPIAGALHKITCTCDKREIWFNVLSSPVRCLHASKFLACAACYDHTLHIFSIQSGRRIAPPLCFGSALSPLAILYCRGHHLMAVDASCRVAVWDSKVKKVTVDHRSFSHIIPESHLRDKSSPSTTLVRQCTLTEQGLPLLTLSDDKSYTFNTDFATWVLVNSGRDAIEQFSEKISLSSSNDVSMTSHEREVFSLLNKRLYNGSGAHAARSFHAPPSMQRNATLSLLEQKVSSSVLLQSLPEYKKWLLAYVRYLVQENLELRLREVCDDLIGPPSSRHSHVNSRTASWKSHIMGIHKRTLLQHEILPVIGSNLSFQRLYTEYQDQLDQIQALRKPVWLTNNT